jgi:hypothetical protein
MPKVNFICSGMIILLSIEPDLLPAEALFLYTPFKGVSSNHPLCGW